MAGWYTVVKTVKGHKYRYLQRSYREGGRVRTRNRYLGPVDGGGAGTTHAKVNGAVITTPLFSSPADFGKALADQFDAPKWGQDAGAQLLRGDSQQSGKQRRGRHHSSGRTEGQQGNGKPQNMPPPSKKPPSAKIAGTHATPADPAKVRSPGHVPRDVQEEITNKIITAIETGQAKGTFQMPWQAIASEGLPTNAVTHEQYHGVNILILSLAAEDHKWPNQWASFQQWKDRGASVRRGEHGTPIFFYSPVQIQDTEEDEEGNKKIVVKTIPVFRYSTVFNIAQVDNPPPEKPAPPDRVNRIENAEQFINATKADIRYGGNRAYFSPKFDYIQMPPREAFTGSKTSSPTEAFYGTVLHELCHWTGGERRLNRDNHNRFGDEAYAAEELVAEIGSAITCAKLGITPELRPDHVQYVASWLKILKEDKRALFTAAAQASHAVDYLETLQSKE